MISGATTADKARFLTDIVPPASRCRCPAFVVATAAIASDWGRTAAHFNYWMLGGRGDRGAYVSVVGTWTGDPREGGYHVERVPFARFSTADAAVDAFCRALPSVPCDRLPDQTSDPALTRQVMREIRQMLGRTRFAAAFAG